MGSLVQQVCWAQIWSSNPADTVATVTDFLPWCLRDDRTLVAFCKGDTKEVVSLAEVMCMITRERGITECRVIDHELENKIKARKSNWIRFFFCPLNQWYHGDAFKKNMGYRGAIEQSCAGEPGRHTGPAELQIQGGTEPADQRFQAQEARWHRFDGKSEIVGPWRSVSQEVLPAASQRKLQGDMGGQGMCENHYIYIYLFMFALYHYLLLCASKSVYLDFPFHQYVLYMFFQLYLFLRNFNDHFSQYIAI